MRPLKTLPSLSLPSLPFPSREPPGGICDVKFPFGAGKCLVCRFLGNVARHRVLGETLACAIPVCPQPGVGHLHPILCSEFSPISPGWKIATSVRRGDCKKKKKGLFLWRGLLRVLVSYGVQHFHCKDRRLKGTCKGERASRCSRCRSRLPGFPRACVWRRLQTA